MPIFMFIHEYSSKSFSGQFRTRIQKDVRSSLRNLTKSRLDQNQNFEKFERGPKSEFDQFEVT